MASRKGLDNLIEKFIFPSLGERRSTSKYLMDDCKMSLFGGTLVLLPSILISLRFKDDAPFYALALSYTPSLMLYGFSYLSYRASKIKKRYEEKKLRKAEWD
jgi:hypothetical protein